MPKDNPPSKPESGDRRRVPIEIDGKRYRAPKPTMKGAELRILADPDIGPDRDLYLETEAVEDPPVGDEEQIDLKPNMVFFSVPKVINPGTTAVAADLPASITEFLDAYPEEVEIHREARRTSIVLHDFPVPRGLSSSTVSVLVDLPPGFNATAPDMFWVNPRLTIDAAGGPAGCQSSRQEYERSWQRWSRHIGKDWRSSVDTLATYVRYITRCLEIEGQRGRGRP